ncbi:hypothetical protein HDV01_006569 [Terramyces sp. JEL0728]|nr:hypothetical protein HDV01_006569 [Terramyces sp. JEL0728]
MIFQALSLALAVSSAPSPNAPTLVAQVTLSHVGFANLVDNSLYLATFDGNPFGGKDAEYYIPDASTIKAGATVTPTLIPGSITWPNTATKAPSSVFGQDGVIISGGFLVPGRSNGGISFSAKNGGQITQLFKGNGYFYHQAEFYDVNQDGQLDIITCRATKPLIGSGHGDLTWLQPADRTKPLGAWTETVIGKGCDTFFTLKDIDGDGNIDLVASQFWGSQLSILKSNAGRFDDYSKLSLTTVDSASGQMFGVEVVDLNADGKLDILATNHDGSGKGGVFAYTNDAGSWTKRVIATGFPILQGGTNQAAPGFASSFYPVVGSTGKPNVVVAGDASQKAYVLTPNSATTSDWTYTNTVIHDCKSTVGGIAVGDTDGDGKNEIYIPCYDNGYLAKYSY